MAFSNIDNLSLGDLLQVYFSNGVRVQISQDYQDWEYIKREKVSDSVARSVNFLLQSSLGPSAVQRKNPGSTGAFPRGQKISTSEKVAYTKQIQATIELEYSVFKRAEMSKDLRYAEPLKLEMDSKLTALKRQLSIELYGDGTGVLGEMGASAGTVTSGNIKFQLATTNTARGHVGNFSFDEIVILRDADGTVTALDTNLATEPAYWMVVDRDFDNDTVTLQGLDSSFAAVTITSITTQAATGAVFYKFAQPTIPDLTASIADYGTVSEAMAGLETLTAADGRVVHGVTMSGATKGSRFDCSDVQIDTTHFESALNNAKLAVGSAAYAWKSAMLAPQVYSQFINGRETDRRFNSVEDTARGARKWTYTHRNDTIDLVSSEFAPKKRIFIIPEARQGQGKVIEYHGTDFMAVKAPGSNSEFHLKPGSGGGHEDVVVSYMDSYGVMINKHPAACVVLHNFNIA